MDVTRVPPRTLPARSAVNEASWSGPQRLARALVLAVVQQRLSRPDDILECLAKLANCRHHAIISESAVDASGGTHSLPESDFLRICAGNGAPPPSRQSVCRRPDGKYYLDLAWRDYDLGVEIHGVPHMRVLNWEADLTRANEIVVAGPRMLVFSSYAVRHEKRRVWDQVARGLRRGGWRD